MDHEAKSLLPWMFAWAGIPLLFAVVAQLVYRTVRHEPPGGHSASWACFGILLAFLVGGTFLVKERLRPRQVWVVPAYAAVMLVLLFTVLAFISLPFASDL